MAANAHLARQRTVGRAKSMAIVGLVLALVGSTLFTTTSTAGANHDGGNHVDTVSFYDTAWDLPTRAAADDIVEYFDHLAEVGFDGVWLSFLPIDGWALDASYGRGFFPASLNAQDEFVFHPDHVDRVRFVLDEAQERGLKVTMAAAWAVAYVHGHWRDGSCQNLNDGPLDRDNAYAYGETIHEAIGGHPALERWLLGGDNFCNEEDVKIWANMAAAIRASGSDLPIGYHTPGGRNRHRRFSNQPWHQFYATQTSHCNSPEKTARELTKLVKSGKGKPVIAAELRYEAIEPGWEVCAEHGIGDPVLPQDVLDDMTSATTAGVSAIVFGHNDRWQWGQFTNGSNGDPMSSLGSPGEVLALQYLQNQGVLASRQPEAHSCAGLAATIIGTAGDDTLKGTNGDDVIAGLAGDDVLIGLGGNDVICGTAGNDTLKGGRGRDTLVGGIGSDVLLGNGGRDILLGGRGEDRCTGGGSKDTANNCETEKSIP